MVVYVLLVVVVLYTVAALDADYLSSSSRQSQLPTSTRSLPPTTRHPVAPTTSGTLSRKLFATRWCAWRRIYCQFCVVLETPL